jgi:hypothetical protein
MTENVPTPEKWIRSKLVTAVGSVAGIFPVLARQDASFPLVVYRRSSTTRQRGLTGNYGRPIAVFLVSIVSESYSQVKDMSEAIRLGLDNFTGEAEGAKIVLSALVSESDSMERPREGQSKPLYRVDHTYEVRFEESIA